MISAEAQRTLVKSPPELWAELSDSESLARHLAELGEIRIVAVEDESKVQWEGEQIAGAVELKASGWGTKVTLTATREPPAPPEPVVEPEPEPVIEAPPALEPASEPKAGFFARIFRRRKRLAPAPESEALEPEPEPTPEPQPQQQDLAAELAALEGSMANETTAVLTGVLDRLGAAHHRPFSRA